MPINWDAVGTPGDTAGILTPHDFDILDGKIPQGEREFSWNGDDDISEATSTNPYTGFEADMAAARRYASQINPLSVFNPKQFAAYQQEHVDRQYQQWLAKNQLQLQMEDLKAAGINPYYLFSGGNPGNISAVQSNASSSSGSGAARLLALLMMLAKFGMAASGNPEGAAAAKVVEKIVRVPYGSHR